MNLKSLISKAAEDHEVREDILASMVWQESGGNPFAIRYEPAFYRRYIKDKDRESLSGHVPSQIPTIETEKIMRSCSFGLMQLMGETLRWYTKTKTPYLTTYLDPTLNLDAGASFLAYLLKKSNQDYTEALRLYNGSASYPPLIFDHVKKKTYLALYP